MHPSGARVILLNTIMVAAAALPAASVPAAVTSTPPPVAVECAASEPEAEEASIPQEQQMSLLQLGPMLHEETKAKFSCKNVTDAYNLNQHEHSQMALCNLVKVAGETPPTCCSSATGPSACCEKDPCTLVEAFAALGMQQQCKEQLLQEEEDVSSAVEKERPGLEHGFFPTSSYVPPSPSTPQYTPPKATPRTGTQWVLWAGTDTKNEVGGVGGRSCGDYPRVVNLCSACAWSECAGLCAKDSTCAGFAYSLAEMCRKCTTTQLASTTSNITWGVYKK